MLVPVVAPGAGAVLVPGVVLVSVLGAGVVAVLVAVLSVPVEGVPPSLPPPQAVNEAAKAKLAAARAIVWNFTINLFRLLRELHRVPGCFCLVALLAARQGSNFHQPDAAQ